jgi:hypothetical protein
MVFYNQASYGFNDYFTMGVGTVPIFFVGVPSPVWITPKVSIPIIPNKLNAGAGVLAATLLGYNSEAQLPLFGIGYGVVTYGSRDNNFNVGVGYGYADGDWTPNPIFNVGFMARATRRTYFVSENWILPSEHQTRGLIMLGGRTVWPQISLDYGIVVPAGGGIFIGIPWIGIAVPFEGTIE